MVSLSQGPMSGTHNGGELNTNRLLTFETRIVYALLFSIRNILHGEQIELRYSQIIKMINNCADRVSTRKP